MVPSSEAHLDVEHTGTSMSKGDKALQTGIHNACFAGPVGDSRDFRVEQCLVPYYRAEGQHDEPTLRAVRIHCLD